MFNIQSYLEKFVRLGLKNEESKKTIQNVLKEVIGVGPELENIVYNKGVVEIRESSPYKNLIYIKKNLILEGFKKNNIKTKDIR